MVHIYRQNILLKKLCMIFRKLFWGWQLHDDLAAEILSAAKPPTKVGTVVYKLFCY